MACKNMSVVAERKGVFAQKMFSLLVLCLCATRTRNQGNSSIKLEYVKICVMNDECKKTVA
jgi:hypothetical protein